MTRFLFAANEVLAFFVELAALAFIAYGGLKAGGIALAVALPLSAAVLWGLFAAPRARFKAPRSARPAVKALVLGGGAMAISAAGHPLLGLAFGVIIGVNTSTATYGRSRGMGFGVNPAPEMHDHA